MTKRHRRKQNRRQESRRGEQRRARPTIDELVALAAEPVPVGSGLQLFGHGRHVYIKTNVIDGSMRAFQFETQRACRRAMAEGMAADAESQPASAAANGHDPQS